MFVTVQVPCKDDAFTTKKQAQLDALTGRDTTVIKRYLTIIAQKEAHLWQANGERRKLDAIKLDALTLTTKNGILGHVSFWKPTRKA
ncbi:MAG: hypothetical protein ACE5OZ_19075 [Candidatus Heimdallarchaeota archaeon]